MVVTKVILDTTYETFDGFYAICSYVRYDN